MFQHVSYIPFFLLYCLFHRSMFLCMQPNLKNSESIDTFSRREWLQSIATSISHIVPFVKQSLLHHECEIHVCFFALMLALRHVFKAPLIQLHQDLMRTTMNLPLEISSAIRLQRPDYAFCNWILTCTLCSVCHRVFANISQTCVHGLLLKLNCYDSCLFGFLFIRSYIIELMLPDDQDIISVADLFDQYFDCRQVRFV